MKLTEKKQVDRAVLLFVLIYTVSYITRTNYSAIISELESALGHSKTMLSMALTGSFITYGLGQIIAGVLGDRFSPKNLITLGLSITTLMNAILPFFSDPYIMLIIWCINGFAQSFLWPPIVKLMTGVVLPVFSILCHQVAARLYKKISNPMLCAGLIFGVSSWPPPFCCR